MVPPAAWPRLLSRARRAPTTRATVLGATALTVLLGATASAPQDLAARNARAAAALVGAGIAGNDVSWPQCAPEQGGYGLPAPGPQARFVVIGLTHGLPLTANPCLGEFADRAWLSALPAHGYVLAGWPSPTQLQATGGRGPWPATTRANRLRNAGAAQARHALDTLAATGFRPGMVWIDVEPLPGHPWPTGSAQRRAANRSVLEGVMRAFADAGTAYGVYSYSAAWKDITGGWRLPLVPVWATAGRSGRAAAVRMCGRASFSGGPVLISQWYDDVRDNDLTCAPFRFTPPVARPPA